MTALVAALIPPVGAVHIDAQNGRVNLLIDLTGTELLLGDDITTSKIHLRRRCYRGCLPGSGTWHTRTPGYWSYWMQHS